VNARQFPADDLWWWVCEDKGVRGGFTWRGAGSKNDFSLPREGEPTAGWRQLKERLGAQAIVQAEQVHGAQIAMVSTEPAHDCTVIPGCDAVICTVARVAVAVRVADCVPVLVWCDKPKRVVSAVHAGWRSLAARIVSGTVETMVAHLGLSPHYLRAAIGPAIGACCFEIRNGVAEGLRLVPGGAAHVDRRGSKWFADLPKLAEAQLLEAGVSPRHIHNVGTCTFHNSEHFFSFRRERESAGRQVGAIMLRNL
jgi:YfiH family protein